MQGIVCLDALELQNVQIGLEVGAVGRVHREVFFADPAPLMLADFAYHVRATSIFFNSNAASFANTYIRIRSGPLFIVFVYLLLASFLFVRWMKTLEAVSLVANVARD